MIEDPIRRCLDFDAWPERDRDLWLAVTSEEDFFGERATRAAHWREPTRERGRQAYGRWIAFLTGTRRLDLTVSPVDRITQDTVRDYVMMLQDQIAPWTVWTYSVGLHQVARAFAPERDWT